MQLAEIYKKFKTPPNLQDHMLRVFGIVELLQKYWVGKAVDWNQTKKLALLHDLGNIVKFNFDNHPEFLGDEQKNIEYWKQVKSETIQKYGVDDDEVTKKMLTEIGFDVEQVERILNKRFSNSVAIEASDDWILKILYYADLRTLPLGVGSLEDRLDDVRSRMPKYTNRPDFEDLVNSCRAIGKQIESQITIPANEINDKTASINYKVLDTEVL